MAALRGRTQRLLAVFFHLTLLFRNSEQRHSDHCDPANLRCELVRDLDRLDGTGMYTQDIERSRDTRLLECIARALSILLQ